MRKLVPILDAGHGGMINGKYQTAGKRSPNWSKGILYEGMFNRWVVTRLIEKLDRAKLPYYFLNPEYKDISLRTRSNRANNIMHENKDTYILSIHANGGGGKGLEVFTSKGYTLSDKLADVFIEDLENTLEDYDFRYDLSDGDKDKEANFWILRKPIGPAILVECGFMDNKADYNNLWDECYLEHIVNSLFESIKKLSEWQN